MLRHQASPVRAALGSFKGTGVAVWAICGTVNLLALTGSFYMLQVYDRVLSSRSVETLVALSVLVLALFLFQGRSRSCARRSSCASAPRSIAA